MKQIHCSAAGGTAVFKLRRNKWTHEMGVNLQSVSKDGREEEDLAMAVSDMAGPGNLVLSITCECCPRQTTLRWHSKKPNPPSQNGGGNPEGDL